MSKLECECKCNNKHRARILPDNTTACLWCVKCHQCNELIDIHDDWLWMHKDWAYCEKCRNIEVIIINKLT
jgi:hypothetical protein